MRRLLLLLTIILLCGNARAAIDFTPTVTSYHSEGAEYSNATFKDADRKVMLAVPRLWSCRRDAARLHLSPPDQAMAEGTVQAAQMKGLLRFDEPTVKSLEQQVLATIPSGSQGATLVSQQENPVIINGNLSYEFVVSYQTMGQTFLRSVVIVACPDQQLIFKFSAPKSVFDALNRSFRQTIYSWQWIEHPEPKSAGQKPAPAVAALTR